MTKRFDNESGLRVPSVTEAQEADKQVWHLIQELCVDHQWSLNDALHEFTVHRSDLAALLQPRVRPPRPVITTVKGDGKRCGKGDPKGEGKSSRGKGRGTGTQNRRWLSELWKSGQRKAICLRYQSGKCNLGSNCKFEHVCAMPKSDGSGVVVITQLLNMIVPPTDRWLLQLCLKLQVQ